MQIRNRSYMLDLSATSITATLECGMPKPSGERLNQTMPVSPVATEGRSPATFAR